MLFSNFVDFCQSSNLVAFVSVLIVALPADECFRTTKNVKAAARRIDARSYGELWALCGFAIVDSVLLSAADVLIDVDVCAFLINLRHIN